MLISEKEIVTVDNKDFIRLADAMQVVAPTATNASRWFKQHQELFSPETFVYSDERFPGKKKRIWVTVPVGFQALVEACVKAPRLKVSEGIESRIAPFEEFMSQIPNPLITKPDKDEVEIEFDLFASSEVMAEVMATSATSATPEGGEGIVYQEPQEKMYGMTESGEVEAGRHAEEWVEFLQQTIANLVARYYTKMCWLKHAQTSAPVEVQSAFADLCNTLHDTLVAETIDELVKFKVSPDADRPTSAQAGKKSYFDEYLAKGYEISFEAAQKEVLCRVLSGSISVNAIALNWQSAFEKAISQIRRFDCNSLYTSDADGDVVIED